jgi:medium-chain acyl-[acyl-carrier-protein] hydrolase
MSGSWILRQAVPCGAFRIFCFPYAGGTAAAYGAWQDEFPDWIEICAIEPPGRRHRMREEPFRRLPDLAEAVIAVLADEMNRPFAFFGHSLGALVAFEVARRLSRDNGPSPAILFLSSAAAPQLRRDKRPVWNLPAPELIADLAAYGGLPSDLLGDPALFEVFLPILRADLEVFGTYSCEDRTRLDVPVCLYGGEQDETVTPARLCAWRELADVVSVRLFPGGHFYLRDHRPLAAAIVHQLRNGIRTDLRGNACQCQ